MFEDKFLYLLVNSVYVKIIFDIDFWVLEFGILYLFYIVLNDFNFLFI